MKQSLVSVGNFDGVHRGHRALVESLHEWRRAQASDKSFRSIVVTFDPHPAEILKPGLFIARLSSPELKKKLLLNLGIDEVLIVPFTQELANTEASEFFHKLLVEKLNPAFIAVGSNFYFGKKRQGTPQTLAQWCKALGIESKIMEPLEADGEVISSSRIRTLIEAGQMAAAARLLGRDYLIEGVVIHGDKRGRQLGFPTANIIPPRNLIGAPCLPANGVYLSTATIEGRTFASITNVGVKPTISANQALNIETHLLDFEGDLYGKVMSVEFRDRLREERKFSSLEDLRKQIQEDTAFARKQLTKI